MHAAAIPEGPSPGTPSRSSIFPLTKSQAFALHLVLSLVAFSMLVVTMLLWWFPGELFLLDGGWQGLRLVAMVDLVLGPALTLLLYKPGKPKLLLDMSLIGAIQIAALGYGFLATWQQRTVAVVHAEGAFTTLSAEAKAEADARLRELEIEPRAIDAIAGVDGDRAVPLLVTPPPTPEEFGQYLADLFNDYPEPHERNDLYRTPTEEADTLAAGALALEELDEALAGPVAAALAEQGAESRRLQLHRFRARYARGIALYDPVAARIVDYVPRAARPQASVAEADPTD